MLILRFRSMPADLNLRWEQRASVLLAGAAAATLGALPVASLAYPDAASWLAAAAVLSLTILAFLNRRFYRFLADLKGRWFAVRTFPLHCVHFLCAGAGFGLGVAKYVAASKPPAPVTEPASNKCGG
jgi:hypothetical protein